MGPKKTNFLQIVQNLNFLSHSVAVSSLYVHTSFSLFLFKRLSLY